MKKLLASICAVLLVSACTSKQGFETYGDESTGGWKDGVNIADLEPTAMTKAFHNETNDVVYFKLNSSSLDAQAKADLKAQAEWLKKNPDDEGDDEFYGSSKAKASKANDSKETKK